MQQIHLIYVSTLQAQLPPQDLTTLLSNSVEKNAKAGVTGMLLISTINVLQVLEGEESAVLATFERIKRDPRHFDLIELICEPIEARAFAEWSMGYRNLNIQATNNEAVKAGLFQLASDGVNLKVKAGIAKSLLRNFIDTNS
jgi:hypothetical protein